MFRRLRRSQAEWAKNILLKLGGMPANYTPQESLSWRLGVAGGPSQEGVSQC
jgi:hypothetical protein